MKEEPETLKAHKCILESRSAVLFDHLKSHNNHLVGMSLEEARFLFEFVYTDEINTANLDRLIKSKQQVSLGEDRHIPCPNEADVDLLDHTSARHSWMLTINRLIRVARRFNLDRLEKLLVSYLIDTFLAVPNILYVLMDALDQVEPLPLVEDVSLFFATEHIKELIKTDDFKRVPKHVLLKIVYKLSA